MKSITKNDIKNCEPHAVGYFRRIADEVDCVAPSINDTIGIFNAMVELPVWDDAFVYELVRLFMNSPFDEREFFNQYYVDAIAHRVQCEEQDKADAAADEIQAATDAAALKFETDYLNGEDFDPYW